MDFEPETSGMSRPESQESTEDRILVCASCTEAMTLAALVEAGSNWSCRVAEGIDALIKKEADTSRRFGRAGVAVGIMWKVLNRFVGGRDMSRAEVFWFLLHVYFYRN